ncbi:MAG: tRNA preQ1(34) S-adenosylmethionine ribosyltransferase-isomerase QueA [Bauldia litoralis]
MKTDDFDFDLPRERIADRPARPRDSARLLTVGETLGDHHVRDLPTLLRPGDLLVLNDTRVIPARLRGRRGEAKVEATLHKRAGGGRWFAFARPAKRLRPGDRIDFGGALAATVAEKGPEGEVLLDFGLEDAPLLAALEEAGEMPLPPYIPRAGGAEAGDSADYQTVYAERPGAVAAPTAGLHFTEGLFRALDDIGIGRVFLTLHVGAGTFLPVKADRVEDHRMHAEWGEISEAAAERINAARDAGGRIVAVGTTSLRLMESAAGEAGRVHPLMGETDIFITPGVPVRSADLMLTNFHLPRSTLFMLVCAFAGVERMRTAYEHAKAEGYRFYSYGDACLLERAA